ncbi:MAG: 6-phosphofructokinase [Bacteroidetes bacterium]|nr:6-phosphofructokinase [Bacteroidota bacterium]
MNTIAVLTSGGDAPGMNAAIRAVVRTAVHSGIKVVGIRRGFQGWVEGDFRPLEAKDVAGIISRGGTILKTARSEAFRTEEGMRAAFQQAQKHEIDGVVLIGGDGTFCGATEFAHRYSLPIIGIPGTIDKDIAGTDFTIGFDTAVNTAVEAIDKIRDTAEAHNRLFLVEIMGRDAGYMALHSGLACGAEDILIPEVQTDIDQVLRRIATDERRKKAVHILVVAEGDEVVGGVHGLQRKLANEFPTLDTRVAVLGHIQRGGSPSCADRVLASRLGYAAVRALIGGQAQVMVGIVNDELVYTPLQCATKKHTQIPADMLDLIRVLAV